MNIEQKSNLIKHNIAEVLTEEDLKMLLESGEQIKHYIGFEISGKVHLGTGLTCMQKVKNFMDAGAECTIFLADWHTWINEKLGGNFETIKRVAVDYFKEAMSVAFECIGGDPKKLKFVLGSDLYHNTNTYWETVIDVAKHVTLSRMQRSITILGRKEGGEVDFAKLIYPAMQVADVFHMGINLAHAGMDQRKAHVIVRDVADKLQLHPLKNKEGKVVKPIAIHHELLLGLGKPEMDITAIKSESEIKEAMESMKMSKSKESSAVFIHDSEEAIKEKIAKAFCPPREIIFNPILNWTRLLIFNNVNSFLEIKRKNQFGGNRNYSDYKTLEADFQKGDLHPLDLKNAVTAKIIKILC
ncbi:MAG: Tyrosine-tRNA ligase [Parcubacteria group bacterium GW2011_GWA2_43_9b]|nr:MAG: Tyrosine-tRNA ligase [Parcubacteria group bacterium GW2011_GWA2_43_9b]